MSFPSGHSRPLVRILTALALVAGGVLVSSTVNHASADACFTWGRTLSQGASGEDVRQLQIRVAGWPGFAGHVAIDGQFGPGTAAAVQRFQSAYGLGADGIAAAPTFNKIYSLQDADCTPIHFAYSELDQNCGRGGWSGGPLSATETRFNALKTMWQLEALRHALGDVPLTITSGFRDIQCNASVGGASNSQHLYGTAADLVGSPSLCRMAQEARSHGFGGIFGPGYPDHSDHTHVDIRTSNSWSAPNCGI
jgi:zinc D-Ala-D-Ala carboxypeptidase